MLLLNWLYEDKSCLPCDSVTFKGDTIEILKFAQIWIWCLFFSLSWFLNIRSFYSNVDNGYQFWVGYNFNSAIIRRGVAKFSPAFGSFSALLVWLGMRFQGFWVWFWRICDILTKTKVSDISTKQAKRMHMRLLTRHLPVTVWLIAEASVFAIYYHGLTDSKTRDITWSLKDFCNVLFDKYLFR